MDHDNSGERPLACRRVKRRLNGFIATLIGDAFAISSESRNGKHYRKQQKNSLGHRASAGSNRISIRSELKLHVHGTVNWIRAIGCDLFKSHLSIHGNRVSHNWHYRIQTHRPVPNLSRFTDDGFCQRTP